MLMVVHVDADGDGSPDATFPLKWVLVVLTAAATACGFIRSTM